MATFEFTSRRRKCRGQAWSLDEIKCCNADFKCGSRGLIPGRSGSAALLSNGNYTFDAGYIDRLSQTSEVTPSGSLVSREQTDELTYRSFRLSSLYGPY